MVKNPKKPKPEDIETVPDAWERFEKAIDKIVPPKRKSADEADNTKKPSK